MIFRSNNTLDTEAIIFGIWNNRDNVEEANKYCTILRYLPHHSKFLG